MKCPECGGCGCLACCWTGFSDSDDETPDPEGGWDREMRADK